MDSNKGTFIRGDFHGSRYWNRLRNSEYFSVLKDRGIILNEPSLVALDERNGDVIAVGERASYMVGRTPKEINVHHPLKGGVIADIAVTEQLLELFILLNLK